MTAFYLLVLCYGGGIHMFGETCILMLDGRSPLSLTERARKADVVISAFTRNAYKQDRTSEDTYTAEFRLLEIFKGANVLTSIKPDGVEKHSEPGGNLKLTMIYNISNFGEKSMCYSSVTIGQSYILFLTTGTDGRLTAKYDDIFGGTAEWSKKNVELVLKGVGK